MADNSRPSYDILKIGDEITVTVLSVKGNQVRLGITVPNDVCVSRQPSSKHHAARIAKARMTIAGRDNVATNVSDTMKSVVLKGQSTTDYLMHLFGLIPPMKNT